MKPSFEVLVPTLELDVIEAYVSGKRPAALKRLYKALEIPDDAEASQIEIAVAQILLRKHEQWLPQCCSFSDGEGVLGRKTLKRATNAPPFTLHPQLLFCLNWADSGPGFSWPESYYITRIPGFDKYIITTSRDSDGAWGCTDHAIGYCDASIPLKEAARHIVIRFWNKQVGEPDEGRWAYLFDEGLISTSEAEEWADEVWDTRPSEDEDEVEFEDEDESDSTELTSPVKITKSRHKNK